MRNSVLEKVDECEQKNEPSKSKSELAGSFALVDCVVVVGDKGGELEGDIGSLEGVAGCRGKHVLGGKGEGDLVGETCHLQNKMFLVCAVHVVEQRSGEQSAGGGTHGVQIGGSTLPDLSLVEADNDVHYIGSDETDGRHAHE